jgi:tetratricopeptide (TPR) repeat protein
LDPENHQVRVNYALALGRMGDSKEAVKQLERVLVHSPDLVGAHIALGAIHSDRGELAAAEKYLRTAVDLDPKPANSARLAGLLQRRGRFEEAVDYFGKARSSGRQLPECRLWHGVLLTWLDRRDQALAAVREDLEVLPDDRSLHMLAARLLAASPEAPLRDGTAALVHARAAAAINPTVAEAEALAMALAGVGRYGQAITWQSAAVDALLGTGNRKAIARARRRLVLYREGKPCRMPWTTDEALIVVPVETPE